MARSPTLLEIIHHHAGYIRVLVSSAETGDAMIISKRAVAPGRGPAWHANRDCRPWSTDTQIAPAALRPEWLRLVRSLHRIRESSRTDHLTRSIRIAGP